MEDPAPENIEGTKQVVHSVEHRINWGYVAVGVAIVVVVLSFGPPLLNQTGEEDEEGTSLP